MATMKKDHYECKGGPGTHFFLPGADLPAKIEYDDLDGHYRRVFNSNTGKTTYVWENK